MWHTTVAEGNALVGRALFQFAALLWLHPVFVGCGLAALLVVSVWALRGGPDRPARKVGAVEAVPIRLHR